MSIEFHCSTCRSLLRIPDNVSGKWISCPSCGSTNAHPGHSPPAKPDFTTPPVDHYPPTQSTNPYGAPAPNPYGAPVSTYASAPPLTRQAIASRTQPAAIVWLVLSALNLVIVLLGLVGGLVSLAENNMNEEDMVTMIFCSIFSIFAICGISGAVCMLRMRYHTFCVVASVATIISSLFCCFIPAGAGIWAIVTLLLPGTRHYFQQRPRSY